MKIVMMFEGQDVEAMDRDKLLHAFKILAAENQRLEREVARLNRSQVDVFRKIASMSGHRVKATV